MKSSRFSSKSDDFERFLESRGLRNELYSNARLTRIVYDISDKFQKKFSRDSQICPGGKLDFDSILIRNHYQGVFAGFAC